jgi:ribonuclease HI
MQSGVVLFISHSHYIHIRYSPGGGTNNRAELIALWTLLETAKEKNMTKLQVFGDSKLVIDWERGQNNIQNPRLASILRDIKLTFRNFEWLSFQHILRELNTKADELSKKPCSCKKEHLDFMSSSKEQKLRQWNSASEECLFFL